MDDAPRSLRRVFDPGTREQIVTVSHVAARAATLAEVPAALHPALRAALAAQGIDRLYTHQARAFELLHGAAPDAETEADRANVVISTGTASGKSLCFALPVLDAALRDDNARALFLYPTKALAQDQARKLSALAADGPTTGIYDGDTPQAQRRLIRQRAGIVLSNPDMLHLGILPAHERWAQFLHDLRYVVLDEAHVYRGVFGSHVAQVVRRLRRLCAAYGSRPAFVLASATMAEPLRFAERLVGLPFTAVEDDGAPHPERTVVLWNPPLEDPDTGRRRSSLTEAGGIAVEAMLGGARAIVFAPTRRAAELVFAAVRRRLQDRSSASERRLADRVLPYRAGYTPQQRRDIERRLFDHDLDAVVATSALELGIDVGTLDLSVVVGFPGTMTSLLQRWGRAGRAGRGWAVLVAGQDALDQFFMREPERLLSRPVEQAIVDLRNPHVLDAHLQAAAYELPLSEGDETYYEQEGMRRAGLLAAAGRLRRTEAGLAWALPHAPAAEVSLRTASSERFQIVELQTGGVLGELDLGRVFSTAHPGAVYLHLGESYVVRELDLEDGVVLVDGFRGGYYTQPKTEKNVFVAGQAGMRPLSPGAALFFGTIEVTEQVVAYQKRDGGDDRVLETLPLDLPEQTFVTEALWFTVTPDLLERALAAAPRDPPSAAAGSGGGGERPAHADPPSSPPPEDSLRIGGSLHAAEHALIALLPLYAMCDRWDLGGLSTSWHWQTDQATVFVYDAYPGGIGLSRRGYEAFESLAADARALVAECPCESGCPSCVQSPKCGNLNEPLDKGGAVALLATMLGDGQTPGGPVPATGEHPDGEVG
jgi:DEAD/DEAH box helicase domain-containing protein